MKPTHLLFLMLLMFTGSCAPMNPVTPTDGTASPAPDPLAAALTARARLDLVERLKIAEDQIVVSSAQAVTWPDSSLGCPQPGMAYAQALVPGYLILLEANGNTWEYHADRKALVFLCEAPQPPVPGTPSDI